MMFRNVSYRARAIALAAIAAMTAGCTADTDADPPRVAETEEIKSPLAREQAPALAAGELDRFAKDRADFAVDFYQAVRASEPGNIFVSPHSVSAALAMTYAGAGSKTAAEMQTALHFSQDSAVLHRGFNQLDQKLRGAGEAHSFRLEIANGLWVQSGRSYEQPFLETLAVNYGTGLQGVDFISEPEPARLAINAWAAKHTADRIQGLFPKDAFEAETRLVLANAIYFKGDWEIGFRAAQRAPFTLLDGTRRDVSMVADSGTTHRRYIRREGLEAVELPYVGGETAMMLIVPEPGRFAGVESSLTGAVLTSILDDATSRRVLLSMPKVQIEQDFPLTKPLKALGMATAFDALGADFSGISKQEQLYVSSVVHKTFLAIDERGTEAAAATAAVVNELPVSLPPPPEVRLTVDRPYLVAILHKSTRTILFLGRVVDPS